MPINCPHSFPSECAESGIVSTAFHYPAFPGPVAQPGISACPTGSLRPSLLYGPCIPTGLPTLLSGDNRTPCPSRCSAAVPRWVPAGRSHRFQGRRYQFHVMTVGPGNSNADGNPLPSVSRERFTPSLPLSVGLGPVASPPKGGLGHGPVQRLPFPIKCPPRRRTPAGPANCHSLWNTPAFRTKLVRSWTVLGAPNSLGRVLPLTAMRST